jgi:hypothetical protein
MTKGEWYGRQTRDKYCIRFQESKQPWNGGWGMSRCFDKTAFEKKQADVFTLKKEMGTLTLNGKLEEDESEGTYQFIEDSNFRKYLTDNSLSSRDENMVFHLYLADVGKPYIEFLKKHYTQISGDRLVELAIHGISLNNYQAYLALFEKHNQSKPSLQEVIEAKIHGIDQAYIEMIQGAGYANLSMKKMMEARIHGVDAEYMNMLKKEGFANLTIDQIISAKIHGVSERTIQPIMALGYGKLSLEKIIEARIHGINAAYIQDLESVGFAKLPLDKLIEAKIHGVNANFIREARDKGYTPESIGEYVELKIHGLHTSRRK